MGLFSKSEAEQTAEYTKYAANNAKGHVRDAARHSAAGRDEAARKSAEHAKQWQADAAAHYQHGEKRGWW